MRATNPWRNAAMLLLSASFLCARQSEAARNARIEAHKQAAQQALARHDLKTVAGEYDAILQLDPRDAGILSAKGILLYASGRPSEAQIALRQALAIEPGNAPTEAFLGLSLADLGRCQEAEPILQRRFTETLEAKTRRLAGLALMACSGLQHRDVAIDTAEKLQLWYPDDADVLYQVAELYSELSRRAVNDLLQKHPDSYRIHELAGEAWEAKGNDDQALSEYRRALEFNGHAQRLHYRIAEILIRKKTPDSDDEALHELAQELAINPSDALSEYRMGELLRKKNDLAQAAAHFIRAIDLDPKIAEPRVGLAKLLTAQGNFDAAIQQLQAAVRLAPEDAAAHYALMQTYKQAGRLDDARHEIAEIQKIHDSEQQKSNDLLHTLLTGPATPR